MPTQNLFFWPTVSGLLTVLVSGWMMAYKRAVQPPVPNAQPMLAFEFARTPAAINALFADPQTGAPATAHIAKIRFLNQLDFLYIFCYTAFSFSFARAAYHLHPTIWGQMALFVAFVPGVFDVLEDTQLFSILNEVERQRAATYQPALSRLAVFTWIKWETLAVVVLLLSPYFWHETGPFHLPARGLVLLAVVVALSGLRALVQRKQGLMPLAYVKLLLAQSLLLVVYAVARYFC